MRIVVDFASEDIVVEDYVGGDIIQLSSGIL